MVLAVVPLIVLGVLVDHIGPDEGRAAASNLRWFIVGMVATVAGLGALVASFLASGLTRQVRAITELLGQLGVGNFEARARVVSHDELGDVAVSLNAMLDNTLSLIQSAD